MVGAFNFSRVSWPTGPLPACEGADFYMELDAARNGAYSDPALREPRGQSLLLCDAVQGKESRVRPMR